MPFIMEEQIKGEVGGSTIKSMLFAVKRHLILVLAVILFCTACGLGYSFIKKPNYTASEEVIYVAEDADGQASKFNDMRTYFNTVVDFIDEGVVVDRANYLYSQYDIKVEDSKNSDYTLDDFIKEIDSFNTLFNNNKENFKPDDLDNYVKQSNVSFSAVVETDETDNYVFSISYTDPDKELAALKAKIYVEACKAELATGEYFKGLTVNIISLGASGVKSDVSKVNITLIGFLVGVVIAAVAVYVINLLDNTVKTKEEIEYITGANVLSYIEYEGGKK